MVSHIQARSLLGSSSGVPGNDGTIEYVIVGGGTVGTSAYHCIIQLVVYVDARIDRVRALRDCGKM